MVSALACCTAGPGSIPARNTTLVSAGVNLLVIFDLFPSPPPRYVTWCGAQSLRWAGCWRMTTCFYHWLIIPTLLPLDLGPGAEPGVWDEPAAEEWLHVYPIIDWLSPLSSPQICDLVRSPEFEMNRLLKNDTCFSYYWLIIPPLLPPDLRPGAEPRVWDEPAAEEWRPFSPVIDWLLSLSSP